jgi:hypothetical protein
MADGLVGRVASSDHQRKSEIKVADVESFTKWRSQKASDGQDRRPHQADTVETTPLTARPAQATIVSFDRHELREIMNVYGRKVAAGEWRDYAIDFGAHRAVFSIFRRASEMPLFQIEKDPKLARKQGAYSVIAATGLILKRGSNLAQVIAVLDKKNIRLVAG